MCFTGVKNHLQALNTSTREGQDCVQTIYFFQNKIKLFQRDINTSSFQHFPLLNCLVNFENDLCSEKIKVYVESLEGVSTNLATMFSDLQSLRPTLVFLINPFVVDVVKD